jgi:hypothetical protein
MTTASIFGVCLVALMLAAATTAAAQNGFGYTFTIVPTHPYAGERLQLRVQTIPNMCVRLPAELGVETLPGNVVSVSVESSDGCFPPNNPAEDRTYDLIALPAGNYTFRFIVCGPPSPGFPDGCQDMEERSVAVFGTRGATLTVPALSDAAAALAALALLLVAWSTLRRPVTAHVKR